MKNKERLRDFRKTIRMLEREFAIEFALGTSCCGVTLAQCHALLELEAFGVASLSELAGELGLDKSTLSRTIDSLVKEGLVERATSSSDRRAVRISLTAKGRQNAAGINKMCDELYGRILAAIPSSAHKMVIESLGLVGRAMARIRRSGKCCHSKENNNG